MAEAAQASLKEIGIEVDINNTLDVNEVVQDASAWDVYAMANVQAPTGDPEYWFRVFALSDSAKNQGKYSNAQLDALDEQLSQNLIRQNVQTFAVQMQQILWMTMPLSFLFLPQDEHNLKIQCIQLYLARL